MKESETLTIRELEILKAALEGDIIRQKKSEKADSPRVETVASRQ